MRENLKNWTPITVEELNGMTTDELKNLLSYCWKYGEYRCETIGIHDVVITPAPEYHFNVSWSDADGDPAIRGLTWKCYIDNIGGSDNRYSYGLYKRKE
jgi:hypothetical protein